MNEIMNLSADDATPDRANVFLSQGITSEIKISARIEEIFEQAMKVFLESARPAAIINDVSVPEFGQIYEGEGRNEGRTPVADIYPRAGNVALFAATVGEKVSAMIEGLFRSNDFAEGCMLDSIASEAAERVADSIQNTYSKYLYDKGKVNKSSGILRYSPGYCGWHISGQKKLFAYLKPEKIGITLTDSYLMKPLKSISGAIIAGPREIHKFKNDYPCCEKCDTQSCLERMQSL